MQILADTHAFLWFVFADSRLSKRAERAFDHATNTVVLGYVNLWEIAVKASIGKLRLGRDYDDFLDQVVLNRSLLLLPIDIPHLRQYARLPFHHRDPFDRLLIAQAKAENISVLTDDPRFREYQVKTIW